MRKKGFTAIEILIVIGILGVLATIVMVSFSNFRDSSILNVETENVVSLVYKARIDSLSSKDDSVYGVHFENSRAVLFKGTTFSEPSADNIEISLDSKVILTDISLNGGGYNVVFKRLSGKTDEYGTMSVVLADSTTTKHTITIYATGMVDVDY